MHDMLNGWCHILWTLKIICLIWPAAVYCLHWRTLKGRGWLKQLRVLVKEQCSCWGRSVIHDQLKKLLNLSTFKLDFVFPLHYSSYEKYVYICKAPCVDENWWIIQDIESVSIYGLNCISCTSQCSTLLLGPLHYSLWEKCMDCM